MPKFMLEVPDTYESVTRPVVLEIARSLFEAMGLSKKTHLFFPNENGKEAQIGSRIDPTDENNRFESAEKISLEVEEDYEADRILATAVYRPEHLFIYKDDALMTYIKPAYSSTGVTINFRYRAKDKTQAKRWRDDIRMRVSMMRDVLLHEASYAFLIPLEMLAILKEIHRLRENVDGYGEDYDTYLKKYSTQRLTNLTNLAGKGDHWAISETQQRIHGYFDFEAAPEKGEQENETDAWTISFAYKFRFEKPVACIMQYPIAVHNQPLAKKFRPQDVPMPEPEQMQGSYSLSMWHLGAFEAKRVVNNFSTTQGVGIPAFDDFIPRQIVPSSLRVFTGLCRITPTDRRSVGDLTQLGEYEIVEEVLDFLRSEVPYMTRPYKSIFNLSLYRGPSLLHHDWLQIDNDLKVRATQDLSLRELYHLRLSVISDLTLLDAAALERLRASPWIFILLLKFIDPKVEVNCGLPTLLSNNYMTREAFNKAVNCIHRQIHGQGDNQIRQFNTVEFLLIQAFRKETS